MAERSHRSVYLYYSDIAKTSPVVDPEEERRLIRQWQQTKDFIARDTLIKSHLRFVVKMARQRTTNPERQQDLIAAGNLGLLKAIERFDLRKRTRFLTYAGWWIQEEMFKEDYSSSTLIHVPTHRQKAQRKRAKEYQRALAIHGPDAKETQRIDPGQPEGATVPMEVLRELCEDNLMRIPQQFDNNDTDHRLRRAVSKLPTREQTVLNLYFGIKDEPRNFVQIADFLGMSPERVRQIKINGMRLLKTTLETKHAVTASCDAY